MDKYISMENLMKRLELVEMDNYGFTLGVQMGVNHAIQCVKEEPDVDVVEVRHGRWIFTEYEFFTCSVCGESYYNGAESTAQAESYLNSGHTYKYCPNCGARMGKEDEHEAD